MIPISIIIRHFNEVENCLDTVSRLVPHLERDDEIIVVDDGSDLGEFSRLKAGLRGSVCWVRRHWRGFKSILDTHGSQAAADVGAESAHNDWLLFLDAHMVFHPGWRQCLDDYIDPEHPHSIISPQWRSCTIDNKSGNVRWPLHGYECVDHWFQKARDGRLSVFSFEKLRRAPQKGSGADQLLWHIAVPMSGAYAMSLETYRRVGGWHGTPFTHGTEIAIALKNWMTWPEDASNMSAPVVVPHGLLIGHIDQGPKTNGWTYQMEGLFNGAALIAITAGPEIAEFWIRAVGRVGYAEPAIEWFMRERDALERLWLDFQDRRRYSLWEWCNHFDIDHPSRIDEAIARMPLTARDHTLDRVDL